MLLSAAAVLQSAVDAPGSDPSAPVVVNGLAYFAAMSAPNSWGLWRTDGTAAGTFQLPAVHLWDSELGPHAAAVGNKLFFSVQGALWTSDGTNAGTQFVMNSVPSGLGTITQIVSFEGSAYFVTSTLSGGGLWKSDGTAAGTVQLKQLSTGGFLQQGGAGSTGGIALAVSGSRLLIDVDGIDRLGIYYDTLWVSDGTGAGTYPLTSDAPGELDTIYPPFAASGGKLYFSGASYNFDGLWVSDGTPGGTIPLVSDTTARMPDDLGPSFIGQTLYFLSYSGSGLTLHLWKTNGTAAGTVAVADLGQTLSSASNSVPTQVLASGTKLYFCTVNQTALETDLWVSDGTAAGTSILKRFNSGPEYGAYPLLAINGTVYFSAAQQGIGWELWKSNGTAAGTVPVKTFAFNFNSSSLRNFSALGSRLLFAADDGTHGLQPWVSDGTAAGTFLLNDIDPTNSLIMGRVFNDVNNSGTWDNAEPTLAGVTVQLLSDNNGTPGSVLQTVGSAGSGEYNFWNIRPGVYHVRQLVPAGYAATSPTGYAATVNVTSSGAWIGGYFGDVLISSVPMDFNYLLTLAQHYGQPGTFASGDLNSDGQVNFNDLLVLAQNYGHPLAPAAAAPASDALLRPAARRRRR